MNDEATTAGPAHEVPAPAPKPAARRTAAPAPEVKTNPYVVKGADIWTSAGRQAEGSVVELTPAEARHFTKIGKLAPYIPGEEHEV